MRRARRALDEVISVRVDRETTAELDAVVAELRLEAGPAADIQRSDAVRLIIERSLRARRRTRKCQQPP
jgi:antitoxin component of RelBE/YafQ-DinJ toxin-antitoxin module